MPRPEIPPQQFVGDVFDGVVVSAGERAALALEPQPGCDTLHTGVCIVRYGIRFLGKPHLSIVPSLVALDYGQFMNGEAAWEFLTRRSNLHPRAEVYGYRNDNRDDMMLVRNLDFAIPVAVLVFADDSAVRPLTSIDGLITGNTFAELPPRLRDSLPHFATISDWMDAA